MYMYVIDNTLYSILFYNSTAEQPVAVLGVCRKNLVPGGGILPGTDCLTADIHDSLRLKTYSTGKSILP